jgi:hypothetical protein
MGAYQEVVEQMVKVFQDHLNEPRPCARTRRPVRRRHGPGEERRRSGLGQRLPSHRARRGAKDRRLASEIAYTQLVAVQTGTEVGAAA